ncbi:tyrosine recombinase XerC [Dysosmobacter sp. HCP28S3_G4]|uniref:tyrosine recombinase XerC n=1 Tax=Dysosmobacter sp. HCP28S3_G4 TaxID=3438938 RepID=UPI003F8C9B7E
MNDYRTEAPPILRDFLAYHETIQGHSKRTVDEYFLDLRNFFRYLKQSRDPSLRNKELDELDIMDVDLEFVKNVTLTDIYEYMAYLSRDRVQHQNSQNSGYGLNAASRARKIATIRSFYKYLTVKAHLLTENPVKDMDSPKLKKTLPKYLTLDQSVQLLDSVHGKNQERDYCILVLFLNCGLRISELVGLNISDIQGEALHILGKGNKMRVVFLNDACQTALEEYLAVRRPITGQDEDALFLSSQNERMSRSAVHAMVKKRLSEAGIDASQYSSHKLRHTAATLMLRNGVDIRAVQEVLGHEHLNTTEIYTHIDNEDLRVAAKANPLSHIKKSKKANKETAE